MNKVIDGLNTQLHAMADKKSLTSEDLKFLEECLYNKWYGVQVNASKVLAKHHPPEASALLKDWFLLHLQDRTMSVMAFRSLIRCLRESDVMWILDLYLKHPRDQLLPFLLERALDEYPNEEAIQILLLACEEQDNTRHLHLLGDVVRKNRGAIAKYLLENPNIPNKERVQWVFSRKPLPVMPLHPIVMKKRRER